MAAGQSSVFQHVLTTFKTKVDPKLASEFQMTTLTDLKGVLSSIQRKHNSERRVRNMGRLSRFLDAMDQYGKVIEVFLNVTDVLAFVWGPMKFLLQAANTFSEAFSKLLETYQVIGESLPLLDKCQGFLENTPYVRQALESIFNDILEFHEYALCYFQKPMWRRVFQASWATYKTRFRPIVDNLYRHKDLLEGRVTFTQLETILSQGERTLQELKRQQNYEVMGKYRAIQAWLGNPDVQTDHESIARARYDTPEAGSWLLRHPLFQPWQDGTSDALLLWLNGIPGAGKSVLASMIVDKCRENASNVTIWFYCRQGDKNRSTFIALARALISQLLKYDMDLVPYVHLKMSSRREQILTSEPLAKELLETLLKNCKGLHIILDGLDECAQGEGKKIIGWFRSVMEASSQPAAASNNPRCVFISQRDAITSRLLRDLPTIAITSAHNHQDITHFVSSWGRKIQDKFSISDDVKEGINERVVERAAGMFLFAKVVMTTLFSQVSRERLFNELNVKGLPVGIEAAYSRVLDVIREQSSKSEAFQLLAWLVCAKRPLEWREIQAAVAIDIEGETVDFYGRQWMVTAKDLCGSLVESRTDGSLELVHTTAELYLVESGVINVGQEELKIASLCLAYLALPGFEAVLADSSVEDFLRLGYYAFLDYAARYWTSHLREGLARGALEQCKDTLISHIERFLDSHYRPCDEDIQIPVSTRSLLNRIHESDFSSHDGFENFLKAFVATECQIETYGEKAESNKALDISDIVARIRTILECAVFRFRGSLDEADRKLFAFYYGEAIYKCSRISCSYFHRGFTSAKEREAHIRKHTLPYTCSYPGCLRAALGFSSQSELQRHISQTHEMAQNKGQIFPPKQKRPVLQCGMCQQSFDIPGKLRNHGCRQDNSKSRLLDRRRVSRPETEPEHLKEVQNRQQVPRGQDPNGRSESTRYATFVSLQRASNAVAAPDHLTGRRGSKHEEEEPVSPTPMALPSTASEAKERQTQTSYGPGHPDWQNHEDSMSSASSHNQAGTNSIRLIGEVSSPASPGSASSRSAPSGPSNNGHRRSDSSSKSVPTLVQTPVQNSFLAAPFQNYEPSSWDASRVVAELAMRKAIIDQQQKHQTYTHSAPQNVDALTGAQYPAHDSYQDQISISYDDQLVLLEQRNNARLAAQRVQAQQSLPELQQFLDQQQHQQQIFQAQQQSPSFESIQRQLRFHNQQQAQANHAQQNSKANNTDTYPLSPSSAIPLDMTKNDPLPPRIQGIYQSQAADTEIAETSTLPSPSDIIDSWVESPEGPDVHTALVDPNLLTQIPKADSLLQPTRSISNGTSSVTPQPKPERPQTVKEIDYQIGAHNESLQGDLDPSLIGRAVEPSHTISNIHQDRLFRPALGSPPTNEAVSDVIVPDEEELRIIKCVCGLDERHRQMVCCAGCTTWQHFACYYADEPVLDVHNCVDCEPRTLVTWDFAKPMDISWIPPWEEVMEFSTLEQRQARYGDVNEFGHQPSESKAPAIHSQPGMNLRVSNSMIPKNLMADRLQAANQGHVSIQSTSPVMPVNNENHFFSHPSTSFIDEGNEEPKNDLPQFQTSDPDSLASQSAISSLVPAVTCEPPQSTTSVNNKPPQNHILKSKEATPLDRKLVVDTLKAVSLEVQKQGPFSKWQANYVGVFRTSNICDMAFALHQLDSRISLDRAAKACLDFETKLFLQSITEDEYENRLVEKHIFLKNIDADRGVGIEGNIDMLLGDD